MFYSLSKEEGGEREENTAWTVKTQRLARGGKGLALKGATFISLSQRTCLVRGMISPLGYRGEEEYLCYVKSGKQKEVSSS